MRTKSFLPSRRGLILAALAVLAPLGLAHAGELNLSAIGEHFQEPTPGATTPSFDSSQYEKLNLSAIGDSAWVRKARGAEGPMRGDSLDSSPHPDWQAIDRDVRMRLGSVGGAGTN